MTRKQAHIRLIEPKAPGPHFYSRIRLPRLGLPLLGTILKNQGHDVRVYCQDIERIDFEDVLRSDLVGISTTTSTAPASYALADQLRQHGIPVVMGGSHVTFCPDEALEHAPYCVRGEGDQAFPLLVDALLQKAKPIAIPNVSYVEGGEVIHNPLDATPIDLDTLPAPDLKLISGHHRMSIYPIMTSRGCPYDCTFCSVTQMFGRRYRTRSIDSVIEEMIASKSGNILFYDDNFTANPNRTKELCEAIIRSGIRTQWGAQSRVEVAEDEDLLRLMRRSGCVTLYIGLESTNPETLAAYNKHQGVGDVEQCVRTLHRHGMMVHGMFVAGSDQDDERDVRNTADFALKNDIETIQISTLTPLPGTRLFSELQSEGRILLKDWSLYDGHHVVFVPKKMTPAALQEASMRATRRFYSLYQCAKNLLRLKFVNAFFKYYGNRQAKRWASWNGSFLRSLRDLSLSRSPDESAAPTP